MNQEFNYNAPNLEHNHNLSDGKLACLFHLLYFANCIIPFSGLIGLIIIRACRDNMGTYLIGQWREALNFQISMFVYFVLFVILVVVIIGIPLLAVLYLFTIIMPIIAAIKTLDGQAFRYPFIFRLI